MKRMINGAEIEYTCDAKGCESFVDDFCCPRAITGTVSTTSQPGTTIDAGYATI